MKSPRTPPRALVFITSTIILLSTSMILVNATTTITVPNASTISYNLAPGANSGAIAPATSRGVILVGTQLEVGNRGVGQATILVPAVAPQFIEWVGLESPSAAAITSGFSSTPGTHIVYLDFVHTVDVEVNSATTIRVHNGNAGIQSGNVTLIW
jgi:hypothetical protein